MSIKGRDLSSIRSTLFNKISATPPRYATTLAKAVRELCSNDNIWAAILTFVIVVAGRLLTSFYTLLQSRSSPNSRLDHVRQQDYLFRPRP